MDRDLALARFAHTSLLLATAPASPDIAPNKTPAHSPHAVAARDLCSPALLSALPSKTFPPVSASSSAARHRLGLRENLDVYGGFGGFGAEFDRASVDLYAGYAGMLRVLHRNSANRTSCDETVMRTSPKATSNLCRTLMPCCLVENRRRES